MVRKWGKDLDKIKISGFRITVKMSRVREEYLLYIKIVNMEIDTLHFIIVHSFVDGYSLWCLAYSIVF